MKKIINRYKNFKKRSFITSTHKGKYAFVGMGSHSIYNLYPIINHFRLELKYIVTKSDANANLVDENFPNSKGTSDLDIVLNDDEIIGVFICTTASAHYNLVKRVLSADKNVFVEKPPCQSLDELDDLIKVENDSKGTCLIGLQKQYAPCNLSLKKQIVPGASYNYRFVTGPYPEGDPFLDLFIHPVSLLIFLFGKIISESILISKNKDNITVFLQLVHKNQLKGSIEISTNYSWKNAIEKLILNVGNGIYEMDNTEQLSYEPLPGNILGIPKEKIGLGTNKSYILEKRNNFLPVLESNQLFTSGYYNEISTFVDICEMGIVTNNSSLTSCREAYITIFKIKNLQSV